MEHKNNSDTSRRMFSPSSKNGTFEIGNSMADFNCTATILAEENCENKEHIGNKVVDNSNSFTKKTTKTTKTSIIHCGICNRKRKFELSLETINKKKRRIVPINNIFNGRNETLSYIFSSFVIPYVYDFVDYTNIKKVCRDFYNRVGQVNPTQLRICWSVNKLEAIKAIQNKDVITLIELDFGGAPTPFYEQNLFTNFTSLKELRIVELPDFSTIRNVILDIPNLEVIRFSECSLGRNLMPEFSRKRTVNYVEFDNCEDLYEQYILYSFSITNINLSFTNCLGVQEYFTSLYPLIKRSIFNMVRNRFLAYCAQHNLVPRNIDVVIRKQMEQHIFNSIFESMIFDRNGYFIGYC